MPRILIPWTSVYCASSSAVYLPASSWGPVGSIGAVRVFWEIAGTSSSDLQIAPSFQLCNVPSSPVDAVGTFLPSSTDYENANGLFPPGQWVDVSTAFAAGQIWRFAWRVKNANGSPTLQCARVQAIVELLNRCS